MKTWITKLWIKLNVRWILCAAAITTFTLLYFIFFWKDLIIYIWSLWTRFATCKQTLLQEERIHSNLLHLSWQYHSNLETFSFPFRMNEMPSSIPSYFTKLLSKSIAVPQHLSWIKVRFMSIEAGLSLLSLLLEHQQHDHYYLHLLVH